MALQTDKLQKKSSAASAHPKKNIPGNAAMLQILQLQKTFAIQREYDDSVREIFNDEKALAVLIKICDKHNVAVGDITFLKSAYVEMDIVTVSKGINTTNIKYFYDNKLSYTERELAEVLSQNMDIRGYILKRERAAMEERASSKAADTDEKCVMAAISGLRYYHATSAQFAPKIAEEGLNPLRGGKRLGISTRGIAAQAAQDTYNKWSQGYTFLTGDRAEAEGYRSKFMDDSGKNDGVIMDIFTDITSLIPCFEVDPDSKGFKSPMPVTEIGYAGELTDSACQLIKDFISRKYRKNVDFNTIRHVYHG